MAVQGEEKIAYCRSGDRLYPGFCSPSLRQRQKGEQEVVRTALSLLAESPDVL